MKIDNRVPKPDPKKDQLDEVRRLRDDMQDRADRAMDEQTAGSAGPRK